MAERAQASRIAKRSGASGGDEDEARDWEYSVQLWNHSDLPIFDPHIYDMSTIPQRSIYPDQINGTMGKNGTLMPGEDVEQIFIDRSPNVADNLWVIFADANRIPWGSDFMEMRPTFKRLKWRHDGRLMLPPRYRRFPEST